MPVKLVLLEALENLCENDFKTLKWHLSTNLLDGYRPIARSHLESAQRTDTVTKVVDSYGEDGAVEVCEYILKKMNHNNTAQELKQGYAAERASVPVSCAPAASGTPAAASMLAQGGSMIVAPTIIGGSPGTMNITINK